jgi:HlyD family secretion protein
MTVSAEIVAARRTGVLMIDSEGVRGASGASPWVLAVRDGRAVRVPVKVGARGTGKVELLDGLKEGDMVVPPAELAVVEGTKVRPAKP